MRRAFWSRLGAPGRSAPSLAPLAALALAACTGMTPKPDSRPASDDPSALAQADVPARLPLPAGTPEAGDDAPAPDWRAQVRSPWLRGLVEAALAHNRDLRVALLNVERAQAQVALANANRWPTLGLGANAARAPNSQGKEATTLSAGVQLSTWEIDLFGRLSSLSDAAKAQLLASVAGRRAAELAVTAAVLQAALVLQTDTELLDLTRRTLASRQDSLKLTALRESAGAASQLDLQAQVALAAQAQAALAQLTRQQAQDRNALALLTGQPLTDTTFAAAAAPSPSLADEAWFAEVPVGLSSDVLLRRPDVVQAEQALRAAQANIAAARAAFWPAITLTAQAGQASPQLAGLFQGGHFAYTLAANAALAIFDGGRRQAGVDSAVAAQRIAQAQYEQAIQSAFKDTADALDGLATWREQLTAQRAQRDAARETDRLVSLKASQGAASALEQQDAQRSLLATEQAVLQARLGELANRLALFKALGG